MAEKINESVAVFNGINIAISSLDDIWLSQKEIAQLFQTSRENVTKHIKAIKSELAGWEGLEVVCKKTLHTTQHGAIAGKKQTKEIELYNFDVICQIGYKINSAVGIRFRQFATKAVREKIEKDATVQIKVSNALMVENKDLKALAQMYCDKFQATKYNLEQLEKVFHFYEALSQYNTVSKTTGKVRDKVRRPQIVSGKGRSCPIFTPYWQPDIFDVSEISTRISLIEQKLDRLLEE